MTNDKIANPLKNVSPQKNSPPKNKKQQLNVRNSEDFPDLLAKEDVYKINQKLIREQKFEQVDQQMFEAGSPVQINQLNEL